MKKILALVTVLLIASIVLTACGGGNGGGENLDGAWAPSGLNPVEDWTITFSGNSFTAGREIANARTRWTEGTFSISNGQIEFIHPDGRTATQSFSRTEDTITINNVSPTTLYRID